MNRRSAIANPPARRNVTTPPYHYRSAPEDSARVARFLDAEQLLVGVQVGGVDVDPAGHGLPPGVRRKVAITCASCAALVTRSM
jgi:hypothetical protein